MLLDFDGPVCDVYAGLPASEVAAQLRTLLVARGADLPEHMLAQDDPLEVLHYSATLGEDLNRATHDVLTELEVNATATAQITPGVEDVVRYAADVGKPVAIVSNNSVAAVRAFLGAHGLLPMIRFIAARAEADPRLMKPNPHLVRKSLIELAAVPARTVLVGDSLTDIQAAKAAGVLSVGYANKPGKVDRFAVTSVDFVITRMHDLLPLL
ncbi:hydrolase [Acrocarpospora corrugata]|uniref:Hydrolase n=1 Tax=Acrocarpospora corrugata TaxID=35763 RepID=A0A5M3WD65_9ACTN|nr:HAD-IA family hydrolase [Acrocarpospora corrugata]GES06279.1 hydrolase [Acrocarpospora corrugata]